MSALTEERTNWVEAWLWIGPALAVGLYAGRLISELLRPGPAGAVLLTFATTAASFYVLRRKTIWNIWPLLILFVYVFYPEPDPRLAITVGLAAVIALLQAAERPSVPAVSNRVADILAAVVLSVGFLVLYVNTLAPDVLPADAGELQLIAAKWGVAHPPGFPFYTILANLFSGLPIGPNEAYRTNLLSAITSTGTLLLLHLSVCRLTGSRLAGLLAAVALGTSTTFWSQATTANVRSLTSLFTAAGFYALLLLRETQINVKATAPSASSKEDTGPEMPENRKVWLKALLVLILVMAVTHHTSLLFIGGIFALCAIYVWPSIVRDRGHWPFLLLAGLLALLPLVYLPIRGAAGAVGAPDNLAELSGFINHVLALGFRGDLFFFDQASVLWTRLLVMVNVLTFQFSPFLLLVMLAGLLLLFRADRLLAVVLAAAVATHTLVAAVYRAPQTIEYMLPVYVLLAVLLGYTAGFSQHIQSDASGGSIRHQTTRIFANLLLCAIILATATQALRNYRSFRQLSVDTTARDYSLPLLQVAPAGAVILADWHWATPLWYLQEVEGVRPDIEVEFVFPGSDPYAETWARHIEIELARDRPVIATHFDRVAYRDLPPAEPFGEAFLFRQEPLRELPTGYSSKAVELSPGLLIEGYQIQSEEIEAGQELVVNVAWRGPNDLSAEPKLYAHLRGPDGRLYAGDDQPALAQPEGLTVSQFRLTPLLQAPPGAYELVIGTYDSRSPGVDHETPLAQIALRARESPPITTNPTFRSLTEESGDRTLIGFDWDNTLPGKERLYLHWSGQDGYETQSVDVDGSQFTLPEWYGPWGIKLAGSSLGLEGPSSYVPLGQGLLWLGQSRYDRQQFSPGRRVKLTQEFTASRPVLRDMVVSLRLVGYGEDGQSWDWWDLDDGVPATGAIPTLKWIAGSQVYDPIYSTISPDAWQSQESEPLLLLYDAFTSRQLPILDERMAQSASWIPLGRVPIMIEIE